MKKFKAKEHPVEIILSNTTERVLPYVRDDNGTIDIMCVSPLHGRSFVLSKDSDSRWIIGKGNGLSYSQQTFVSAYEGDSSVWGGLCLENAERDFHICNEVQSLGIKTNVMHYVLGLDKYYTTDSKLQQYALLQYEVECPYRIVDFPFMSKREVERYMESWPVKYNYSKRVLQVADILANNLRTLHDHNILHNAMHAQNYTWALELLDFEASRTDRYPYASKEYEECISAIMPSEIIQLYEIINYIAWCLGENVEYGEIDRILCDYGYDLSLLKQD